MNSFLTRSNLNIYHSLPASLQSFFTSLYGLAESFRRTGSSFRYYQKLLSKLEYSDSYFINNYQRFFLLQLLESAVATSPYYASILNDLDSFIESNSIHNILSNIPILTKDIVRANRDNILGSSSSRSDLIKGKTSGSTGSSLHFFTTSGAVAFQWAIWWRYRNRFNFTPNDWHINFTGKPAIAMDISTPPYVRHDFFRHQVVLPSNQLVPSKIAKLVDFMNHSSCQFITGYPSMIAQFCHLVEAAGLSVDIKPKAVSTGAERLSSHHHMIINRVLSPNLITDQYGFAEGCGNASRCEYGNYHVDWEYGILECLNGVKNPDGSITGDIVATGFSNFAFPFIRYKTGDTGTFAPSDFICPCGRKSQVLFSIDGRTEDSILTPEGNRISRLDYLFKDTQTIYEAQVCQYRLDTLRIKYVPSVGVGASDADLQLIREIVRDMVSPTIAVAFESVREIPRLPNGKFKAVISQLVD